MKDTIRRAALLLLVDRKARLLLQHRDDGAPAYPGQWGLFGGGVEPGESPWEGLLREAQEELRYDAQGAAVAFVLQHFVASRASTLERHYFIERYDARQELELNEGQAMAWTSLEDLQGVHLTTQTTAAMGRIKNAVGCMPPIGERGQ